MPFKTIFTSLVNYDENGLIEMKTFIFAKTKKRLHNSELIKQHEFFH